MDYYNADGSVAQMCGNGLRVFARFLRTEGLIDGDEAEVATRSGAKRVRLFDDGTVRAELGPVIGKYDEIVASSVPLDESCRHHEVIVSSRWVSTSPTA